MSAEVDSAENTSSLVSAPTTISPMELGRQLSIIRGRADISQADLARRVTWSPTVLNRVENGDRPLADEELQNILAAIGTPEATDLGKQLQRNWVVLPRPPLDHPEQEALWAAELVAQKVDALRRQPEIKHVFEQRLSTYLDELRTTAGLLLKRDHQVAFVGSIGVGKSTALCRLTGLEIPGTEPGEILPVLETGAGGTTICEVHLRNGPLYGLIIEPRMEEDIRADVMDLAAYLCRETGGNKRNSAEEEGQGISKEVERAIRGMSGLSSKKTKGADGKTIRTDPAQDLAKELKSAREVGVAILARMELHRRGRCDIWHDPASGKPKRAWLRETFAKINNGRHEDFTIPRRIEVIIPDSDYRILGENQLTIRLVDTKGIDRIAARADIEGLLDDPHTVTVLCSPFNNAPAAETRLLLERAQQAGVRDIEGKAALLILPRPREALAMKDDATNSAVDSTEEGYELKGEQISLSLKPLNLDGLTIGFFNAHEDDAETFQSFLLRRIGHARQAISARLTEISFNASSLLENHEKAQQQEVLFAAAKHIRINLGKIRAPDIGGVHLQDSLLEQIKMAHAATVRATSSRRGEWHNLNYAHHLGYGARRMAAMSLSAHVDSFTNYCSLLAENDDYDGANELLSQVQRLLESAFNDLLRKLQLHGESVFRDNLQQDFDFWRVVVGEWGQGPGYKGRVAEHNADWFSDEDRKRMEKQLFDLIQKDWEESLDRIANLLPVADH